MQHAVAFHQIIAVVDNELVAQGQPAVIVVVLYHVVMAVD